MLYRPTSVFLKFINRAPLWLMLLRNSAQHWVQPDKAAGIEIKSFQECTPSICARRQGAYDL